MLRHAAIALALPLFALALPGIAAPALDPPASKSPAKPAAHTPEAVQTLFARYDRLPEGAARDQLAAEIDAAAHQKYAHVSRLYWHTDFAAAQAAARAEKKPILHLRMLGRLDEELSCANSRYFRTTLYPNVEVANLLRDKFVLYWSSERAVPRVTIDFGDGRKLERTTTGNSAHYVLDADGTVLDVLPGLYAPVAFRAELTKSLALATKIAGLAADARTAAIIAHHQAVLASIDTGWSKVVGTPWLVDARSLLTRDRVDSALARAQQAAMMKAAVEVPDLRYFTGDAPELASDSTIAMWASAGQVLYGIGDIAKREGDDVMLMRAGRPRPGAREMRADINPKLPPAMVLDAPSRALVVKLHDALPAELRGSPASRDAMLARLEQHIVADTAQNQLQLRRQIASEIVRRGGRTDFATLNTWIYAQVFHTPKSDAWLGLLPRTDFTGLPGDGVVMPERVATP